VHPPVASDKHDMLAALLRRENQSFVELLARLDQAIGRALSEDVSPLRSIAEPPSMLPPADTYAACSHRAPDHFELFAARATGRESSRVSSTWTVGEAVSSRAPVGCRTMNVLGSIPRVCHFCVTSTAGCWTSVSALAGCASTAPSASAPITVMNRVFI
jgi:hypothetical protein